MKITPFIEKTELSGLMVGSFESISESIRSRLGDEYVVIATFPDYAIVSNGETVFNASWSTASEGVDIKSSSEIGNVLVTDANIGRFVSRKISEAVKAIVKGDDPCNQLHSIQMLIKDNHVEDSYWVSDHRSLIDECVDGDALWIDAYKRNREEVRKTLRGTLGELENSVPKSRYGKIPSHRLEDFRSELEQSFDNVVSLLSDVKVLTDKCFENVVSCGISLEEAAKSLFDEASKLRKASESVAVLAASADLPIVAGLHDKLSGRIKDMLVMSTFISRAATQSNGE